MDTPETAAGQEFVLRSTGIARFFEVGFLGVWLIGWAAGEAFAWWMLIVGGWSFFTGQPPETGREPITLAVAVMGGLFLVFWLSIWTYGGIAAGQEFLRRLFGRDRILTNVNGLTIRQGYGLFTVTKELRREAIRRIYARRSHGALCADTTNGVVEITRLGKWQERIALEQTLKSLFGIVAEPATNQLPPGWCEGSSLEREPILVKDPVVRRKQARFAWVVCMVLTCMAGYVITEAPQRPDLWTPGIVLAVLAAGSGWGAAWLQFSRVEWLVQEGRLIKQHRFGQNRTKKFEATALELIENTSGDNGPDYDLLAVAPDAIPRPQSYRIGKHRRKIYGVTDDPTEPRNLGLWLSGRCSIPFTDETTEEAKAQQLAEIRGKLANSGWLGQATLRVIDNLASRR